MIFSKVRVAVLDKVTDFLLFVGKLVVTAVVALISFVYFSVRTPSSFRLQPRCGRQTSIHRRLFLLCVRDGSGHPVPLLPCRLQSWPF